MASKIDREVVNVMGAVAAFGKKVDGKIEINLIPFNHFGVINRRSEDPEYVPMLLADDNVSYIRASLKDGFIGIELDPPENDKEERQICSRLRDWVKKEKIDLPEDEDDDLDEDEDEDEDEEDLDDDLDDLDEDDKPVRVRPARR